jgi:hypothetical protein
MATEWASVKRQGRISRVDSVVFLVEDKIPSVDKVEAEIIHARPLETDRYV